ncbi:MAG: preprotein translocase subunit SecY [Spirochaetales bacterium]
MFTTLKNAFKDKDIRKKILLTFFLILLFRLGSWLPVPGIEPSLFAAQTESGFLALLSGLSGGALGNGAFLALGVSPYISASIIIQLLTVAIPSLERLSKLGEEGKKKLAKYTKVTALFLSVANAIGIVVSFGNQGGINTALFGASSPAWLASAFVALVLTAGGMFTYWIGEKISEIGIGNGLSLLIFVGILSTAGTAMLQSVQNVIDSSIDDLWSILIFLTALILIFGLIVFIDLSERKIPVQYAKQIKGRKMYGGQSTYIPVRVNGSGVLPIIFAMSILAFPQLIMSIFWPTSSFYNWYQTYLGTGTWVYSILVGLLILFFAYFYSQISFNPADVSKHIQQNGGFIPGIRAGKPTADYLTKISKRITLFGAIFLAFIAIVPTLIFKAIGNSALIGAFSATGMLIVVSVALEFNKQLEAQMLMKNYKGFLK